VDERDGWRRERRIAEARFPRIKRLDDFDLSAAPTIPPATLAALAALAALASLAWVAAGEPVALLGDPGTGKRSRGTPTSTAVASNVPFSEWTSIFPDTRRTLKGGTTLGGGDPTRPS
jgi:IstB-like ATP binding protein